MEAKKAQQSLESTYKQLDSVSLQIDPITLVSLVCSAQIWKVSCRGCVVWSVRWL